MEPALHVVVSRRGFAAVSDTVAPLNALMSLLMFTKCFLASAQSTKAASSFLRSQLERGLAAQVTQGGPKARTSVLV